MDGERLADFLEKLVNEAIATMSVEELREVVANQERQLATARAYLAAKEAVDG